MDSFDMLQVEDYEILEGYMDEFLIIEAGEGKS